MQRSRYRRSYKEKRNHNSVRIKFILLGILFICFYLIINQYLIQTMQIKTEIMSPALPVGARVLTTPLGIDQSNKLNFLDRDDNSVHRGDLVCYRDNIFRENNRLINFLNPVIRFFSFQKINLSSYERPSWELPYSVKRVIGIPGDTIKMENNTFYIKPEGQSFFLSEYELVDKIYDTGIDGDMDFWPDNEILSSEYPEIKLEDNQFFLAGDIRNSSNGSLYTGPVNRIQLKAKVLLKYWPLKQIGLP